MWASSQPRENEQCLLRGAQNSLSRGACRPVRQQGASISFLNLGGNRAGKAGWGERTLDVGLGVGRLCRAGCTLGGRRGPLLYMPLSS